MTPKLKSVLNGFGMVLLSVGGTALLIILCVITIKGSVWLSETVLPFLVVVDVWLIYGCFLILLPMCIFSPLRVFAGTCLFVISYVFGLSSMGMAMVSTYDLWGIVGVLIGLVFAGVGIVPLSLIATGINGHWVEFWLILGMAAVGILCRIIALYVLAKQAQEKRRQEIEQVWENPPIETEATKPGLPFYKTTSAWLRHVRANQPKRTVEEVRQQVREVMGEDFKVNPPYRPKA